MNEATKKTLKLLDGLVRSVRRDSRIVYMRPGPAYMIYKLDPGRLMSEARESGAVYQVGKVKLIKLETLEKHLESKGLLEVMV